MMRIWAVILVTLGVTACTDIQNAADQAARAQAKNSVAIVVAQKLPGADVSRVTDCIIDAATAQELLRLSAATVTGVDRKTTDLVGQISARPQSIKCIAQNALAAL